MRTLTHESPLSLGLTVGRLALIPLIILTLGRGSATTAVGVAAFVLIDVLDGMFARGQGLDGPGRRALDSIVDRLAIDACLIGACLYGLLPPALLIVFLLRDAYCAALCTDMVRRTGNVIKADWTHRSLNLAVAAWGACSPLMPDALRVATAVCVLGGSLVVAADLRRMTRNVVGHQVWSHQVIDARAARTTQTIR